MTELFQLKLIEPPPGGLNGLRQKLDRLEQPYRRNWKGKLAIISFVILCAMSFFLTPNRHTMPELEATAIYRLNQKQFKPSVSVHNGAAVLIAEANKTRVYLISSD